MRSHAKALIAVTALMTTLAIGVAGAGASTTRAHLGYLAFQPNPHAIAIDQSNGEVYVLDTTDNSVSRYDASGSPVPFSALNGSNVINGSDAGSDNDLTPQGGFSFDSSSQIAVDSSGTATDGNVYVASSNNNVVSIFDSTGAYAGQLQGQGTNSAEPTQTWAESSAYPCGLATDSAGRLYVSTAFNGQIDRYDPAGAIPTDAELEAQITELPFGTCGLAVDSSGNPHATTNVFGSPGVLTKYAAADFGSANPAGTIIDPAATAVFVDPSNGDVFVANGPAATQYDSAGTQIVAFGQGLLTDSHGVAIDRSPTASNGTIYASSSPEGGGFVASFGEIITQPEAQIAPASAITVESATLNGEVNPEGVASSYRFEYRVKGAESWTQTPTEEAGSGSSFIPVQAALTGLAPDTDYEFRLVIANANGSETSEVESLSTVVGPPIAETRPALEITGTTARLRAGINPAGLQTSYQFEWGPSTSYGNSIPLSPTSVGAGNQAVTVSQLIDGLAPGATYHYRVVAENGEGPAAGADRTFTTDSSASACPNEAVRITQGSQHLPNCMAWEKVSPDDKNGGEAWFKQGTVQVALSGDRVAWYSQTSFLEAGSAPRFNQYLSSRSPNGWTTRNIAQPAINDVYASYFARLGFRWYSPDLTVGYFMRNDGPGTNRNLYHYDFSSNVSTRITPDPITAVSEFQAPWEDFGVLDGTPDGSHILFESRQQLTPDAPAVSGNPLDANLYEAIDGQIGFVGKLPDGSAAPSSVGGRSSYIHSWVAEQRGSRVMSVDGTRIYFTVPDPVDDGANYGRSGEIYLRKNGETTHVSASQRTDCAEDPTCGGNGEPDPAPDPDGPGRVYFGSATPDGAFVFFLTCRKLTDDAEGNCEGSAAGTRREIYRYEVATGELISITAGAPAPKDFVETSDDGQTAYYASDLDMRVWRNDSVTLVGDANTGGANQQNYHHAIGGRTARVSPDGRFLTWVSSKSLAEGDGGGYAMLYLYDSEAGEIDCVSCPSDGSPATAAVSVWTLHSTLQNPAYEPSNFDAGQRWVFFTTAQGLVPRDTNANVDVYRYDVATGEQSLISSGSQAGPAYFGDVSPDGKTVTIVTLQRLVGTDRDSSRDVYAVRAEGGFAEPQRPQPQCDGDECQGAAAAGPGQDRLGSAQAPASAANCRHERKGVDDARKALRKAGRGDAKGRARAKLRKARKKLTACNQRMGS